MDHSGHQKQGTGTAHSSAHGGHNHAAMIADFRQRFWVSLTLTIPSNFPTSIALVEYIQRGGFLATPTPATWEGPHQRHDPGNDAKNQQEAKQTPKQDHECRPDPAVTIEKTTHHIRPHFLFLIVLATPWTQN